MVLAFFNIRGFNCCCTEISLMLLMVSIFLANVNILISFLIINSKLRNEFGLKKELKKAPQ